VDLGRIHAAESLHVRLDGVRRALADLPRADVNPAHAGPRAEGHGLGTFQFTPADVESLLGENDDRASLRRLVCLEDGKRFKWLKRTLSTIYVAVSSDYVI
jgi:hypothetical protein